MANILNIKLEYTGGDKEAVNTAPSNEKKYYITSDDLNEIKRVVNILSDNIVLINDNEKKYISQLINDIRIYYFW